MSFNKRVLNYRNRAKQRYYNARHWARKSRWIKSGGKVKR